MQLGAKTLLSGFSLDIRGPKNYPKVLTSPVVNTEINITYGVRAKDQGLTAPPPGAHVGATISVTLPGGTPAVASTITAAEVWAGGMQGDQEVTKTFHVPTPASGDYVITIASEYGLFWSWDGYLGYGAWIGIAADDRPAVAKIWEPSQITQQGIKISESYTFTKP